MKILLINLPTKEHPLVRDMAGGVGFDGGELLLLPPMDLAYMAATLLAKGHSVKIIDSDAQGYCADDVYQAVKEYGPEAVIAGVSLPNLYQDCLVLKEIRNHSACRVFAKTNINFAPVLKEICQRSLADMCVYGESDMVRVDAVNKPPQRVEKLTMKLLEEIAFWVAAFVFIISLAAWGFVIWLTGTGA